MNTQQPIGSTCDDNVFNGKELNNCTHFSKKSIGQKIITFWKCNVCGEKYETTTEEGASYGICDCPNACQLECLDKGESDYEYFENKAVKEYKEKLKSEIESWAVNISSEKNPRWVKNTIINIIETLK